MECFVIFVMAWCWCNATESKPQNVTTHLKKTIVIALTTVLILIFIVLSMGGGHGFFWPAKVVYPYSMIISVLNNQIGILAIIIAIVQIPIYGILMTKKPKWTIIIFGIHIVSAIICLNLPTETFSG